MIFERFHNLLEEKDKLGIHIFHPSRVQSWETFPSTSTMPKDTKQKRNGASHGAPYANSQPKASNKIFKMNTNIGQHVLKNPGVAQAIVDKADLKQSDVRNLLNTYF